jgi:hypothetical protein
MGTMGMKRRIRSAAATSMFLLLLATTFFTYWQKASASAAGAQPTAYGAIQSGPDELQRWGARALPTPIGDELQRWESHYPNVAR